MQTRFTLGREPLDDPYHVDIIREKLMRTLVAVLPDVIDEVTLAVPDHIPTTGDGMRVRLILPPECRCVVLQNGPRLMS